MFRLIFKIVVFSHEKAVAVFRLARDKEWDENLSIKIEIVCDDVGLKVERAF